MTGLPLLYIHDLRSCWLPHMYKHGPCTLHCLVCVHSPSSTYSSLPHHVFGRLVILSHQEVPSSFVLPSVICQSPLARAYGVEYFPHVSSGVGCSLQRSLRYRWPRGTTYVLVVWCDDNSGLIYVPYFYYCFRLVCAQLL